MASAPPELAEPVGAVEPRHRRRRHPRRIAAERVRRRALPMGAGGASDRDVRRRMGREEPWLPRRRSWLSPLAPWSLAIAGGGILGGLLQSGFGVVPFPWVLAA